MVSFPYYSHTIPIRIPKEMGIVWEAYHKQVPLLEVPENPIDLNLKQLRRSKSVNVDSVAWPDLSLLDTGITAGYESNE